MCIELFGIGRKLEEHVCGVKGRLPAALGVRRACLVTALSCPPSALCHGRDHLVPRVRPPRDHHRELRLLPVRGLDRRRAVPRGRLRHRLLCWRRPVVRRKPFLLLLGLQLPHSCQECPRIRGLLSPPTEVLQMLGPWPWVCLPQAGEAHSAARLQSQSSRKASCLAFFSLNTPLPICCLKRNLQLRKCPHTFLMVLPIVSSFLGHSFVHRYVYVYIFFSLFKF